MTNWIGTIEQVHNWGDCEKHDADDGFRHCHCAVTVSAIRANAARTCRHCLAVVTHESIETSQWEPAVGDYVETGDGVVGVLHKIENGGSLLARYTVVDCDGMEHHTSSVALLTN